MTTNTIHDDATAWRELAGQLMLNEVAESLFARTPVVDRLLARNK